MTSPATEPPSLSRSTAAGPRASNPTTSLPNSNRLRPERVHQRTVKNRTQRNDGLNAVDDFGNTHTPHHPAAVSKKLGVTRRCPSLEQRFLDAQLAQRRHRVGREVEREAELTRLRGALEHADVPSCFLERDACSEAADASSDDQRRARLRHNRGASAARCVARQTLPRDEHELARVGRPVFASVVAGVQVLDLEAGAREQVLDLESKQVPHAERMDQPLRPSIGMYDVVDQLNVVDLSESIGCNDLEAPCHAPSVRRSELELQDRSPDRGAVSPVHRATD